MKKKINIILALICGLAVWSSCGNVDRKYEDEIETALDSLEYTIESAPQQMEEGDAEWKEIEKQYERHLFYANRYTENMTEEEKEELQDLKKRYHLLEQKHKQIRKVQ